VRAGRSLIPDVVYQFSFELANPTDNQFPDIAQVIQESMSLKYEPASEPLHILDNQFPDIAQVFFVFTLVTGPRRSLSLKLSDARVYEPQLRARLGTTTHFCAREPPGQSVPGHRPGLNQFKNNLLAEM